MALVLGLAGTASAFTLSGNEDLTGGGEVLDGTDHDGLAETVTPSGVTYYWATGGSSGSAVSANLDLGSYYLYRNDVTNGITLDLNGGDLTGDSGSLGSPHNALYTGTSATSANIVIDGANNIDAGRVYLQGQSGSAYIGETTSVVTGDIRLDEIRATSNNYTAPTIRIYSLGDVEIAYSGGVTEDNDLHIDYAGKGGYGSIIVYHDGSFLADDILGHPDTSGEKRPGAPFFANGDYADNGILATDTFTVDRIVLGDGKELGGGTIKIGNYSDVTINDINSSSTSASVTTYPGIPDANVYIGDDPYTSDTTEVVTGDILIKGTINLNRPFSTSYPDGALIMATTGGSITLGDSTSDVINWNLVDYVSFDSGIGNSIITGSLANLPLTTSGGSGTFADPYVLTGANLRVPDGQYVFYTYEGGGLNDPLGGYVYKVAALDGTAGGGGLLLTEVPPVAEPAGLGLIGLALLGLRKRRS